MKHTLKLILQFSILVAAITLTGCGGEGSVRANFISNGTTSRQMKFFAADEVLREGLKYVAHEKGRATAQVGQTTATSLESLQYYVQSIQLCNSITINGTGYSGTSGCANVYVDTAAQSTDLYNSFAITEAQADTTNYVDFLDDTSRAKLEAAAAIAAGTYNYVLINYMRPIKIKATFSNPSGTAIHYSKAEGTIVDGGLDSGGRQIESFQPTDTTTAPAGLMTYMVNNGGAFIPLMKPFVVAAGDSVVMDFVFNPANFATTTETTAGCTAPTNTPYTFDLTNCVDFSLPLAKMQPVPRLSTETTVKEVYLVTGFTTGTSASNLRIELYYNSADTEKSIRGVDTATVYTAGATTSDGGGVQAYEVSETNNVVSFKGYNSSTQQIDFTTLTNLTRRADGTLTINCNFTGGPCAAVGDTADFAYTYVGDVTVQ